MERKVTKLESCHVQVDVVVDKENWKQAQEKAFKKLASNLTVDGFRKGKVPEAIARKHIDQMKLINEAINVVLPVAYQEVLTEEKIEPFSQPSVDITKVTLDELELKFVITTAPEVKLGKYKGLELGKKEAKVTAKEVNEAIDNLRTQNASLVLKEGESALGDTLVFDFVGMVDGVAFEGGRAQNYSLELGSKKFIPGFEDQLVGAKAGEHVEVNVKFPENYVENLKGKDAVFACDVHEVKEKKLPELNDEFVKELKIKDVETVDQLKAFKSGEIKANKENSEKREYLNKVVDEIAKNSTVDFADEIIEAQIDARKQDFEKRVGQSGLTFEQYLQLVGQTEEQFKEQVKGDATRDLTRFVIMQAVAKAEQLTLTDEEVEFEYARLAEQYGMKAEDVKKAIAAQVNEFKNELFMRKVEAFLSENNQ